MMWIVEFLQGFSSLPGEGGVTLDAPHLGTSFGLVNGYVTGGAWFGFLGNGLNGFYEGGVAVMLCRGLCRLSLQGSSRFCRSRRERLVTLWAHL